MIALRLLRVVALSTALTAAAAALLALVGWFVLNLFGAVTAVLLYAALNLVLLIGLAGVITGKVAASSEREHPVALALSAAAVLYLVILVIARWAEVFEPVAAFALLVLPMAAVSASRQQRR
jgi:hypothetical protein